MEFKMILTKLNSSILTQIYYFWDFRMFVVVWNLTATFHIYYVKPNLHDKSSEDFCDPSTYYLAFVLVILFDVTFAIISFIWVSALIAGKFSNHLYVRNNTI